MLLFMVAACNSNEPTLEQAIEAKIPNKILQILYTEQQGDGTVTFFLTNEENSPHSVIGFAFVEKVGDGWVLDPGSVTLRRLPKQGLTLFYEDLLRSGQEKVSYTYGKVGNPAITQIEVALPDNTNFRKANVISTSHGRFYFEKGYHLKVRGLSNEGTILDEQG
jgi:hypothetical protein